MYLKQMAAGRLFLHEHPANATSWSDPEVKAISTMNGVKIVVADQCMFGLRTTGATKSSSAPAKKPTKFMTNCWSIAV